MPNTFHKLSRLGLGVSMFLTVSAFAADNDLPKLVEISVPVQQVFTPKGFDTNDNAQIVVTGAYPNSCYKMGPTDVKIDPLTKTIRVDVKAFYTTNSYCLMLYIPFAQAVSVGVLPEGQYKLIVNSQPSGEVPVKLATKDQPDDYVYATVWTLSRRSERRFELQGFLPDSCSQISEIRVLEEKGDVFTILPIVKLSRGCEPDLTPANLNYTVEFDVPAGLKGKKLFHVRSLNGAGINQIFDF